MTIGQQIEFKYVLIYDRLSKCMTISRETNEEETVIKPVPYVNGVMKGSEKENASMGYLKCRKIKEMRKTVILVGNN